MQSVQIIPSQSIGPAGPLAEPSEADGGFGRAFDEARETKAGPAVGGDGAVLVAAPMPIWFDATALTPAADDSMAGLPVSAPGRGVILAPAGEADVAIGAIETADAAAGMTFATWQTPPEGAVPAIPPPDAAVGSGSAIPAQAAPPEAARPLAASSDTSPTADGATAPVPAAEAAPRLAAAGPGMAEVAAEPSVSGPLGQKSAAEAGPFEALKEPAARAVAAEPAPWPKGDAPDGTSVPARASGPVEPRAIAAPVVTLADTRPPAAVVGPVTPAPDDIAPNGLPRDGETPEVARLVLSGREMPLAGIEGPAPRQAEPVLAEAKTAAPVVEVTPGAAPTDGAEPVARMPDVAPATGASPVPGPAGADGWRDPGQVLPANRPEPTPVETAPGVLAPEADDPKALLPGVWERLFTGILAPATQQAQGLRAAQADIPSLAGMMPAEAGPRATADAATDMAQASGDAQPPSGPDPRKATVAGPSALPVPQSFDVAFDPFLTPDIVPDPADSGIAAAGGLTGPITSAATVTGSTAALSALPVPQVAAQISAALSRLADGSTELALAPEELGRVRLKLKPDVAHPDRMVVMITFERPETLELFRKHAGDLADALRSAGYAGADIGFGQDGGTATGSDRRDRPAASAQDTAFKSDSPGIAPPAPRLVAGASLDLRL